MFVSNYFIDSPSEAGLSSDLSRELSRAFTGEKKVKRKTAGSEQQCGSFLVCIG